MDTIYKYEFPLSDTIRIAMPEGAEILHVDLQRGVPCLWARVETGADLVMREFSVIGTGQEIREDGLTHVGTFQVLPFVWHLFEVAR